MEFRIVEGFLVGGLEEEVTFFESRKRELLEDHREKFALIKGSRLVTTFVRGEDAYEEGIKQFGNEPFLIKQIVESETPVFFPGFSLGMIRGHL